MAIVLRDLLARVALYRPDKDEATHLFALQEAARSVCRYSQLATVSQKRVVTAGTTSFVTAAHSTTGIECIRVESLRFAPVPTGCTSLGPWDPSTAVPTLGANKTFYVCSADANGYLAGDVILSNGTAWKTIKITEYVYGCEDSKPRIEKANNSPQTGTGDPTRWAQENGSVFFYPALGGDYPIELMVSTVPVGEFDSVPLPNEAEDAIVWGAMEFTYNLPGDGMNPAKGMEMARRFMAAKDNLRSLHYVGFGGDFIQTPPSFTGRTSPMGPYRLSPRYL